MPKGRPKGSADLRKLLRVFHVLAKNPQGLWIREIARQAKVHPSTVSNYANSLLAPILEDICLEREEKPILRVIRLKEGILKRLQSGEKPEEILFSLELIKLTTRKK